jgi:hypothetical protein
MTYDHFLNGKENILNGIFEELNNDLEEKEQEKIKKDEDNFDPKPKMDWFPTEKSIERKPRKPKRLGPEYVFIFDDLGADLRDKSITQLFKTSRHYKAKVIVSSQYVHDLSNSCIKNLNHLIKKSFWFCLKHLTYLLNLRNLKIIFRSNSSTV